MSKKSWLEEFYPTEACDTTPSKAIQHSLTKWIGALPTNLKKHGLKKPPIEFADETCSLCLHFREADEKPNIYKECPDCPLCIARDNYPCTYERPEEVDAPYDYFLNHDDPIPMIAWLTATLFDQQAKKVRK